MPRALALADDTTGALELGALCASLGVRARVLLDPAGSPTGDPDVLVIDTRTRHLTAGRAADRVRAAASRYRGVPVYKKTDSTLRGQIAAELDALLETVPPGPLLPGPLVYVPAYPKLGRTVERGILRLDDVPVAETEFARDLRQPVRESSVPRLLRKTSAFPVEEISSAGPLAAALRAGGARILVCDARTEQHLAELAAVWAQHLPPSPAAGPGGFAVHWLRELLQLPAVEVTPARFPAVPAAVAVNGSLHPRSRGQIDSARTRLGPLWTFLDARDLPAGSPHAIARELASRTAAALTAAGAGTLVVFGGDTAAAVFAELGVAELTPVGEILPGVAVSAFAWRGGDWWAITKAGGFGPPDLLVRLAAGAHESPAGRCPP
jgi:uncharacterized protein YgbK (DUF1537 family)